MRWTFHRADATSQSREKVVGGWASAECAQWKERGIDRSEAYRWFAHLNEVVSTVFVFDLDTSGATMLPKKGIYEPGRIEGHPQSARAELYLNFLTLVCQGAISQHTRIAVDVDDLCPSWHDCPVFTFQKLRGCCNLLLPDVDFITSNFYEAANFWGVPDKTSYKNKVRKAIFVGSTTGLKEIKKQDVDAGAVPRIRSARFFRGNPDVAFLLTKIVQCDSEAASLLKQEGFGGSHVSWQEQLQNRFLLSMDGNGATCSRIYVALSSNSCLLKYASKFDLYYFRGLKEWTHYLPLEDDRDVLDLLRQEAASPRQFAHIAAAGKEFARDYLQKEMVLYYTRSLIERYEDFIS